MGNLYHPLEGVKRMKDREGGCEMLTSGRDMAVACVKSQQLQLSVHKTKPDSNSSTGWGVS